jgi:4-hydroxy-3-polyprenylbenzoate decarboxylase
MSRLIVAVSGGSGAIYARRLLEVLGAAGHTIHLTVSDAARKVIAQELTLQLNLRDGEDVVRALAPAAADIAYHHYQDVAAPIASGSFKTDGMVVVPCSMGTMGRIASGISTGLIDRAADVCLKERRRLILVPRETPYSAIHLENMLKVTRAGAIVLPASPGFYGHPTEIGQLIDFVVARILDHLGVDNELAPRYGRLGAAAEDP